MIVALKSNVAEVLSDNHVACVGSTMQVLRPTAVSASHDSNCGKLRYNHMARKLRLLVLVEEELRIPSGQFGSNTMQNPEQPLGPGMEP